MVFRIPVRLVRCCYQVIIANGNLYMCHELFIALHGAEALTPEVLKGECL